MKENRDCKIVRDLLPNYIEKLTDEETNKYIEEHLNSCMECKRILEETKQKIEIETKESDKRKVNGFKKYNRKLRALRMILILIVLIIVCTFIITTVRSMIIINNLSNLAEEYKNIDNYHITMYNYSDGKFYKDETYKMGDKVKVINVIVENGEITTTISIGNKNNDVEYEEYNTHEYININNDDKILLTDGKWGTIGGSDNVLHTENLWDLFKCAVKARIEERTFKGKNCYYVDNFESNERGNTLEGMYIDKETGLEIYSNKKNSEEYVFETVYEFNTVTEEDFIEPDASEYKTMTRNEYYTSLVEESEK